jgi:hypothetical protein
MLKTRRDAAMKVVECLYGAEDAIDTALARTADLNGTIVTARERSRLVGPCRP